MKIVHAIFAIAFLSFGIAEASAADSALAVIKRHVTNVQNGDIEGVLADFAPDAVLVTQKDMFPPTDVYKGTDGLRQIFSKLMDKDNLPLQKLVKFTFESKAPDIMVLHWSGYKNQTGHDVFVVRGGKIVFQGVFPDKNS